MTYNEIKIIRTWPIINGYVQIPNNLPSDKTRLKANNLVGAVPSGMIVQYSKGSKQGAQSFFTLQPLAPNEWYSINPVDIANSWVSSALLALNASYSSITDLVPRIYKFWDDVTDAGDGPTYRGINDGGDDMYDGANYLNTNLTQAYDDIKEGQVDGDIVKSYLSILYTHTQADDEDDSNEYTNPPMDGTVEPGTTYFGPGSEYFTNMYPGLFILVADNISITEFSVGGNHGADGNGTTETGLENLDNNNWCLSFKAVTDGGDGDPTINHILLVPGNTSGLSQQFDETNEDDDHGLFNLQGRKRLIFAVVATQPDTAPLTLEEAKVIAAKILEVISSA